MGSNIEPRSEHLDAAVVSLRATPGIRVLAVSTRHETDAVGPPGGPKQGKYLNAACLVETSLTPRELLSVCLEIERTRGRDRASQERWGPRTLDLDLLLYRDLRIDEPGLTVPHPRLHERLFVLAPLVEIAPDWEVPGLKKTVAALLSILRDQTR